MYQRIYFLYLFIKIEVILKFAFYLFIYFFFGSFDNFMVGLKIDDLTNKIKIKVCEFE